jgi:hypothetical protein
MATRKTKTRTKTRTKTQPAKTKKKPAAPKGDAKVTVKVDRALKAAWDRAAATLETTKVQGARAWDQLWETVGDVLEHEPPLYLAGGFATAREFLAAYAEGTDERAARRNVRVAKVASPDEEVRYTVMKLDEALNYLEAKLGGPPRGRVPIDFEKLRIPVAGHPAGRPLDEVTVQDLRAATRALDPKHAARSSPVVAELVRALGTVPAAKGVTVHYANGYVSLTHVPARAFRDVMRALAKATVPTPEPR